MTKQSFIDQFFILYDSISDFSGPGYTPAELSEIASKVQEDLIIEGYGHQSNRLGEGFEQTEKRTEDIAEIVKYQLFVPVIGTFLDNSWTVTLPNTLVTSGPADFSDVYWFTIYEECTSNILDCSIPNNTTVYVKPRISESSHASLIIALQNPFTRPYLKNGEGKVISLRSEGRKVNIITDGSFSITKYKIGYIRKPLPIDLVTAPLTSQVSELSDEKHREILAATVTYCFKITNQQNAFKLDAALPKE